MAYQSVIRHPHTFHSIRLVHGQTRLLNHACLQALAHRYTSLILNNRREKIPWKFTIIL